MSYKDDLAQGLNAVIGASAQTVASAVRRAAEPLGEKAEVSETSPGQLVVVMYPGVWKKMSHRSPIVTVSLRETGGKTEIATYISAHVQRQRKFLVFIPSGPKELIGKGLHRRFLDALEAELAALDPHAAITRRTHRTDVARAS